MTFKKVIEINMEIFNEDFDRMIEYLRVYPVNYSEAIYEILEEKYEREEIMAIEDLIIEELKKRDIEDKKKGTIYLNDDDYFIIKEFSYLINRLFEELDGKKSFEKIISQLLDEKSISSGYSGIKKIKF